MCCELSLFGWTYPFPYVFLTMILSKLEYRGAAAAARSAGADAQILVTVSVVKLPFGLTSPTKLTTQSLKPAHCSDGLALEYQEVKVVDHAGFCSLAYD